MSSQNVQLEELTNFDESIHLVKNYTTLPVLDVSPIICDIFIKTLNMPALTDWKDETKPFISELYIVPRLKYISEEIKDKVFDSMGFDESLKKYGTEFAQIEFINYGLGIRLAGGMESYATKEEAIEAMKNKVIPISILIGFYMDKAWNKIGTTGWDTLNELVSNVDQFKVSLDRALQTKEITQ